MINNVNLLYGAVAIGNKPCRGPQFVKVPLTFQIPNGMSNGTLLLDDELDLTTYTNGQPAPILDYVQSLIVSIQGGPDSAVGFIFDFQNGYTCAAYGNTVGGQIFQPVLVQTPPVLRIRAFSQSLGSAAVDNTVNTALYFGNFPVNPGQLNYPNFVLV